MAGKNKKAGKPNNEPTKIVNNPPHTVQTTKQEEQANKN